MMIYMLAAAMTLAMLIGTVLSLHEEAQKIKLESRAKQQRGFGIQR
jgi:hypothetical protein